ncbi:uncharacterized protein PEZ65_009144 [Lycodopsis pacificus]
MSNGTFIISTDQVESTVLLPHREALTPESPCSNSSPSPDSNSSVSNLSDREANSSPDINILECCLSDGSFVDNSYNTTVPQDDVFCGVRMNLNQTFLATAVDGSATFWNENLSLSNHKTRLDTENGSSSAVTTPDSAGRESQLSSFETSHRGSTENDCCSLSSGEMIIRSNSLCQEDQSHLVVSSLEESSISLTAGHPAFPAESNLLLITLPDGLEKSTDRVTEENMDYQSLGMTFTQAELHTEENDMAKSNSLVALPSENEGRLLMTFLCESSADSGKAVPFASAEAELLPRFLGAFTPEQGETFLSTLSAIQHTDEDTCTSTPVQNIGNVIPSRLSFLESPCSGNAGSPGLHPVKQQQISVTANCLVAASKVKKMEIKKFPRSDFSSVKSKVLTRIVHQKSVSGPASLHKPSQVNVNNKHTEARSGPPIRSSPAKFRSSASVLSTTTKVVNDAQRQVNTGAANWGVTFVQSGHIAVDGRGKSTASPPCQHPAANKHASAVQCSNPSSEAEQAASSQVADAAALHSGNQTLCFSSLEKNPSRSSQTDPKPTPKKGVFSKIGVRSLLKTRTRCSSDSLSLSSTQSREKGTTSILKADTHLDQTKPGNLNCSSLNKQAVQTEATNVPAEISPREVKRISLVVSMDLQSPANRLQREPPVMRVGSDFEDSQLRDNQEDHHFHILQQPVPHQPLCYPGGGREPNGGMNAGPPKL